MNALLEVILPVYVVMGAGWIAARSKLFSDGAVDGLMRFAQMFAIPCLLFRSIATLDLSATFDPGLLLSFYIGAFSGFAAGFAGAKLLFGRPTADAVAIGFCCLFSNSLLLGLPITERAYGPDALASNYAILSIHAPMFYAFGIVLMEVVRSRGAGLSGRAVAAKAARAIFSNALVIGIGLGLAVNLTGTPLPVPVSEGVNLIASGAIPAALFGLGGVMVRYKPEGDSATVAMIAGVSLLLHPGITYLLGRHAFGLTTDQLRSAVVTAAMAPGINAYLFASIYGVAMRVTATAVIVATGASILTIWGWLHVLP
jgi:malonate transporter and related proteins